MLHLLALLLSARPGGAKAHGGAAPSPRAVYASCAPLLAALLAAAMPRSALAQLPMGWSPYPAPNFGFDLPGNASFPINAAALGVTDPSALQLATGGQCNYIEQQFMELFSGPSLNLTRWLPSGSVQPPVGVKPTTYGTSNFPTPWGPELFGAYQAHCPSAGAVGAASPSTCTIMDPAGLRIGQTFADGSTGASMTLSQAPCYNPDGSNNPACCNSQTINKKVNGVTQSFVVNVCSSWSGTHLSSQFCAQYGVLEVEARYDMPADGGAYQFLGLYQFSCQGPDGSSYNSASPNCDPYWNEVRLLSRPCA